MTDSSARPSRTSLLPPIDPDKFASLEQSFLEANDPVKLGRLYSSFAAQQASPAEAAARLRHGVEVLTQIANSQEQVSWLLHELVRLDPQDEDAFDAVRTYYESTEKHRELVRLFEDLFEHASELAPDRERELRASLFKMYRDEVGDNVKAAEQLALLLGFDAPDDELLEQAEDLLNTRELIVHLGAPLSLVYRKQGKASRELSLLTRELEVARGDRLSEVQSRLAALRQEFLEDRDGAMELLEPLVSRDPAHDEARQRYLHLCETQGTLLDAVRRIERALGGVRDARAEARVRLDLARALVNFDDKQQAKAMLLQALRADPEPNVALAAAQLLRQSFVDLAEEESVSCLLAVAAHEREPAPRHAAATTLLQLGPEGVSLSRPQRRLALAALLDSEGAHEILDELEALSELDDDVLGRCRVLERRSELSEDSEQAAQFAFRAAELFEQSTSDSEAHLERWQEFTRRFGNHAGGVERLADLLERAGRIDELVEVLRRSAPRFPPKDSARFLGRAGQLELTRSADVEAALEELERALDLDPEQPEAVAALEDVMLRGTKRLDAARVLEAAARRSGNHALLADVLAVEAELLSDTEARKARDIEVFELLRDKLDDPQRALALAARVLKDATSRDPEALVPWLDRIRSIDVPDELVSLRARVLLSALGERNIDSPELFTLARDAGSALTVAGNFEAASSIYEKALMFDPSAADLALGLDALRAKQGVGGAQRVAYLELSLIDVEENVQSWCRVMGAIAHIRRNELGDPEGAAQAYREVVERVPEDREAHRALVEIFQDTSDTEALAAELERAVSVFEGGDKLHAEFSLAMLQADAGDANRAVELCNKLLDTGDLDAEQLDAIADLAEQGEPALLRRVQERRIQDAEDPLTRAQELERLGVLLSDLLEDTEAAAAAFKRAAAESLQVPGEEEYAKTLFERVLDVKPRDQDTAEQFVRFCIDAGDWDRIASGIGVLIALDASRAAAFVLELALCAKSDQAALRFVSVADDVLEALTADDELSHALMLAKAEVLASDPAQRVDASQAFRAVIEAFGKQEDEQQFQRFIKLCPVDDDRTDDQRWLFERLASSAEDPISVFLEWARVEEEEFADPEAAIGVYDQLIERYPEEQRALERAARLKLQCGAHEGALEVLRQLKDVSSRAQRPSVQLRIVALLIGDLERPEVGYAELSGLLAEHSDHRAALAVAYEGLASEATRLTAARALAPLFEVDARSGAAGDEPFQELLERMLEALADSDELREERKAWYDRLIGVKSGVEALTLSCRAAAELPEGLELWERAERLAAELELPEPVADAYERALQRELPQELVGMLGRRMLEFHEQWFGDSAVLLPALLNLLKQTPHARWALDRAVLALNSQGRFEEVFALFDAAITFAPEGDERTSLLDEAALTAKDLANDPERAIHYLEQLVELKPGDARVQSTLERLYKRCGQTRKLIDLLSKRLVALQGPDLIAMLDQIACRWLELDHSDEALECARRILEVEPDSERACGILERILGTEAFAELDSWSDASGSDLLETREQAAEVLKSTYQRLGRTADVARIAEAELEFLDDAGKQGQVLREIVAAKLGDLDDKLGAFTSLGKLVMLEPTSAEPRAQLRQLAEDLNEPRRYAELLVRAAENSSAECELFLEAAQCYTEKLADAARETELYERVLQLAPDDSTVLSAARALDRLLSGSEDVDHHSEVLERLAGVETDSERRRDALVRAARHAAGPLSDWERAAKNWREVLSFAPEDREALDGLIAVLSSARQWRELVDVLEVRAGLQKGSAARPDHVLIARILAEHLAENAKAIERWRLIRERFEPDAENFQALSKLLESEQRWEALAELLSVEAANAEGDQRAELLVRLAVLRRDHLQDYSGALEAFVSAREWRDAVSIIEAADTPERAASLTDSLRIIAIERWHAGDEHAEDAAYWAIKSRAQQLLDMLDHANRDSRARDDSPADRAYALLIEAIQLPFSVVRRRSLQRAAALVAADAMRDSDKALEILGRLFDENVTDAAAIKSVTKYSELLEQSGRHTDRAELWERIARALARLGDQAGARSYWEHAGQLWEQLEEPPLAIAAYRHAADLESVAALEALARLELERGDRHAALDALERVCDLSTGDELVACAGRVVDLCFELGERHKARRRLETAVASMPGMLPLRARLAQLYVDEQAWSSLVELLLDELPMHSEVEQRLPLLSRIARLYIERLEDPASAVPLLEQARALTPDDRGLRLAVAEARSLAGAHQQAIAELQAEIDSYGARRPKTRARAHRMLARALKAAGKQAEAVEQLSIAAEINSTDAGVLFEYATAALNAGDLERAEQTFRASLLVLHRPSGDAVLPVTRADVYISLSDVAAAKGDRLATKDFVESAFETALEGREEALQLEQALEKRAKDDLLKRALETRFSRSAELGDRLGALAELTFVYSRLDEKDARLDFVRSAAEDLKRELAAAAEPANWLALARVWAWLGDERREVDALEAYVLAMPVQEFRAVHADACYRVAEARIADEADADSALEFVRRGVALNPEPKRRDALLDQALRTYPQHAGFARAFVRAARVSGRENQLAEALAHLATLPEATLEEGRQAVRQCASVANAGLLEQASSALLVRDDLDAETRYDVRTQLAQHYQQSGRLAEAFDLNLTLADEAEPADRERLLEEAAALLEAGLNDDQRAARVYRRLLNDRPTDRSVWEPLFSTYLRLGDHAELKQIIEQTLPKVRGADRGALRLAQARLLLTRESDVDAAVATLETALDEDPNQRDAAELLAETLERLGRLDELVGVFEGQLVQARGRGDRARVEALTLRVGALLERAERPKDAVQVYLALLSERPQHLAALRALVALSERVVVDGIVAHMRRLLELEDGKRAARVALRLFELLSKSAEPAECIEVLEQGFAKCPGDAELRRNLVEAHSQSLDVESAAGVLTRAVEALPADAELLGEAVEAWSRVGQPERALELLDRRLGQRPGDAALHFGRYQVLSTMGRDDEALAALQRAYDEGGEHGEQLIVALEALSQKKGRPESDLLILRLADLLEKHADPHSAREHLRGLLRDSPDNVQALTRLAQLAEQHDDVTDIIQAYRGLLRLERGDQLVPIVFKLIDACEQLNRSSEVLDDLERAREKLPDHERLRDRVRAVYEKSGETRRLADILVDDAARREQPRAKAALLVQAARILIDSDSARAQALLEQAERAHASLESGVLLARLRAEHGQRDEALVELERLAAPQESRKPAARARAYWELARLHLQSDEIREAFDALNQAQKLERRNGEVALTLGMLAIDLDDEKTAGRALRSVTAMKIRSSASQGASSDEQAQAYYLLGTMARRKGDTSGARRLVQKAVNLDPEHKDAQLLLDVL